MTSALHPSVAEDSARIADDLIVWIKKNGPARIDSPLIDQQQCIPPSVVMDLAATGVLGMIIPPEYGGLGLQHRDIIRVLAQLAAVDLNVAIFVLDGVMAAHALLGTAGESVKREILPGLAQGRIICAFAVTEPGAGSNPRAMTMTASPDGAGGWRLNGSKAWVGSGSWASHILLWAESNDAFGNPLGVTGFVVRQDAGGVSVGAQAQMLGLRGVPKNPVYFNGTPVTPREILGEVGQGMESVQATMSYTRLCLAAMTVGVMKRCVVLMGGYAERRTISTGPLLDNPVTLAKLSELTSAICAVEVLCGDLAQRYDQGMPVATELTAIAKIIGSEHLGQAADAFIQMLGARGYEETNFAPRILRDSRAFRLFEGPTETLTMHIGASAVHSGDGLYGYLHHALEDAAAADRLRNIAEAIRRDCLGSGSEDARLSWAYALAGETAVAIVVDSTLRRARDIAGDSVPAPALSWAHTWCERSISRALEASARPLPGSGDVLAMLDAFEEGIGKQRWDYPGIEQQADDLVTGAAASAARPDLEQPTRGAFPWNRQIVPPADDVCLHELIETSVRRHPEKIALRWGEHSMTYRELDERAASIARELTRREVGPEHLVAVCLPRGTDQIAAILGVLKAGGCYLPVDPAQPGKHLAGILDHADPALVITRTGLEDVLGAHSAKAVRLDQIKDSALEVTELPERTTSSTAAYVIYTSGSTGVPKGVVIEHHAAVNFVRSAARRYGLGPEDCMMQFASPAFDAAVEEIFCCLAVGGTLILRPDEVPDPTALLAMCEDQQVTVLDLPTSYWHELTRTVSSQGLSLPAALRTVIIGGERPDPGILMNWRKSLGSYPELLNTYGPTETTVVAAACSLSEVPFREDVPHEFPIGRPLDNVTLHVLDERMRPISSFGVGELYIGGAGVARGYLNDPELTKARFRTLPGSEERVYRTGDLVRWTEDGNLEFAGRIDDQVKIRGFRVEPDAVATVLTAHPAVHESFVTPHEDSTGNLQLIGYFTAADGGQVSIEEIREHVADHLPAYMHPSAYVILDAMPRGASHKVDRKRLPKPENTTSGNDAIPRSGIEETMGQIWAEVLGTQLGPDDLFLAAGGHSLSAMRLIAKIRETLGITLPASAIFKNGTIAGLCRYLEETGQVPAQNPDDKDIVIIGSGPAGVSAFLHLVQGGGIRSIRILDPNPVGSGGTAFTPDAASFITNASADVMSLLSGAPHDFVEYLRSSGRALDPSEFVPRSWVGEYIQTRYREYCEIARTRGIDVAHIGATVRSINPRRDAAGYDVGLDTGASLTATHVILATGRSERKVAAGLAAYQNHPRLIAAPYPLTRVRERVGEDPARILIIGTGQSAIDTALYLGDLGHSVTMTSVSGIFPAVKTRTSRPPKEHGIAERLRAVLAPGEEFDQKLLERTITDMLSLISPVPLGEQVCTLTDPAARIRAEIEIAEQDLNWWQDLVVEAIDEVGKWAEGVSPDVSGPVLYRYKWVLRRYGDAIPLSSARRVLAAIDRGLLDIRQQYPEDMRAAGEKWQIVWPDAVSRFDYIVQAIGADMPAIGATLPGYHLGTPPGDATIADLDERLRVQNPFTRDAENIWAIGEASRSRNPIANPLMIAVRHAGQTAETILGTETVETITL